MRPLDLVIDATLKLIPDDFASKKALEAELAFLKEAYLMKTEPEVYCWFHFGSLLQRALGEPDTAWKTEVVELLQGKKDYSEVLGES